MGLVDNILQSKLLRLQESYSRCVYRAGFRPVNFSDVLSQAELQQVSAVPVQPAVTVKAAGQMPGAYTAAVQKGEKTGVQTPYEDIIGRAAATYGLDPALLKAVIRVESSFHKDSVSHCGAMGLMQLMPGTAKSLGVKDAFDPEQNIFGGAAYIRRQLDRFDDIRLALVAYNTGPHRVGTLKIADPGDPEEYAKLSRGVRGYVKKVLDYRDYYAGLTA